MNWKGRTLTTYQDLIDVVVGCKTEEEAQEFLHAYQEVNPAARDNIGYLRGYLSREEGQRLMDIFKCPHPVFGWTFPTPDEAFQAGLKMGQMIREHGVQKANELMGHTNPNPWFIGAMEKL